MNIEWTRHKLQDFAELARKYDASTGGLGAYPADEPLRQQLYRAEPTVRKIFESLDPRLADQFNLGKPAGAGGAVYLVEQALGILDDRAEWSSNLGPTAPALSADHFHPWVWQAAQTLWESKHYRMAVHAAATAICAHTQTKIERTDIFDDDLMNQAFTEKPRPGQAYLRLPGDASDLTIKSRNNALRPFAQGCFAGIRNPASHQHGVEWPQQQALEQLAALSVLARWIDDCAVLRGT